jgi:hypothetical protein
MKPLPDEILVEILSNLEAKDMKNTKLVCKKAKEILEDKDLLGNTTHNRVVMEYVKRLDKLIKNSFSIDVVFGELIGGDEDPSNLQTKIERAEKRIEKNAHIGRDVRKKALHMLGLLRVHLDLTLMDLNGESLYE